MARKRTQNDNSTIASLRYEKVRMKARAQGRQWERDDNTKDIIETLACLQRMIKKLGFKKTRQVLEEIDLPL
jgi:hypothetical protein